MKWWGKVACWLHGGHNLIGVELPPGWTIQSCRTCGEPVEAFGPIRIGGYREIPEPREEAQ